MEDPFLRGCYLLCAGSARELSSTNVLTNHLSFLIRVDRPLLKEETISKRKSPRKRPSIQTNELRSVSKRLGTLAIARYRQSGEFRVRQQEQIRRALSVAGEALDWGQLEVELPGDAEEVEADIRRLTQAGIRQLERDLEDEIAQKRKEIRQLEKTVSAMAKLGEKDETVFPTEVEYQYTSRRGKDELVTRTEEVVLEDPDHAVKEAEKLEKKLDRLGRLRDQMVENLKKQRQTIKSAKSEVKSFVNGTEFLVDEVMATLT